MPENDVNPNTPVELIDHLCRHSRLTEQEAEHLVTEVLAYFSQTPDEFVRTRHQQLQSQGYSNRSIFLTLQHEVNIGRFTAKPMTTRQIRRTIYG